MTKISDLPKDLTKEIFSRVPLTSLNEVRSTCKTWNSISKSQVLCESAARRKHFLGFMMKDYRVCSLKFDLQGIQNEADVVNPSIMPVSVFDQVDISQIFQCEGLLLCVTKDKSRLLVWNPYLGQTRWIQPRNSFHKLDGYAIGYDKNCNYKILRIFGECGRISKDMVLGYEVFDLSSNSWKVFNVKLNGNILCYQRGVSLKGNTYFLAEEKIKGGDNIERILSFSFTKERFGKLLPLPFKSHKTDKLVLSCVRDEQLAVLHDSCVTTGHALEIWITNKIDPGEVSWSKFLRFTSSCMSNINLGGSFFVDEEKKVVVVADLDCYYKLTVRGRNLAHIIGQDGYFKSVNIGESRYPGKRDRNGDVIPEFCRPLVCSSYVPSSVQLPTNQPVKSEESEI